jgi:hypothetical protein
LLAEANETIAQLDGEDAFDCEIVKATSMSKFKSKLERWRQRIRNQKKLATDPFAESARKLDILLKNCLGSCEATDLDKALQVSAMEKV